MKKNDRQTFEMLQKELKKSFDSAQIPLRLQKESIVTMLKSDERGEMDFSCETGNKSKSIIILRKATVIAAMFAIVVVCALFMRMGGIRVIKTDSFYKGYESQTPVKNAQSYEEVEQAVREILDGKAGANSASPGSATANSSGNAGGSSETAKRGVFDGYSQYFATAKSNFESFGNLLQEADRANEISVSGDFKADIVKSDGEFLYIVTTGADSASGTNVEQIKIVRASPADKMEVVSTIALSQAGSADTVDECIEIYLKGKRLIALMSRYSYSMSGSAAYDELSTIAIYYDISDPTAPVKVREHVQDGEYVSSSLHGGKLCLVTAKSIPTLAAQSGAIPSFAVDGSAVTLKAEDIFIAVNDPEASYLFITVTDITNLNSAVGHLAVLGCGSAVSCFQNAVTISRGFISVDADENGVRSSLTEVYRFDISSAKISFGGSYIVEGSLIGAPSIDEASGYLRVATVTPQSSNIYVLNEKMEFVSALKDIFKGEKVKSVKFAGSNGYIVAGDDSEKTMIIDFSDPAKPTAGGTISTKGFSGSLYAVSDTMILGISELPSDGSAEQAVTLFLLDAGDPKNPKTASVYTLDGGCYLPSAGDSRSVMLIPDKKIFGIPVVKRNPSAGTEISAYILFSISDGTISPIGTYNHDTAYIGDAAVRGTCMGDTLYTVSGEKITAFSVEKGAVISSLAIR